MKQDNSHTDPQLEPLLDALREHGRNQRRQQALSDKIDQLAGLPSSGTSALPTSNAPAQSRSLQSRWIWAAVSAAAVALVLLILVPSPSHSPSTIGMVAEAQCAKELPQCAMKEDSPTATLPQLSSHPQRVVTTQLAATSSDATPLPDVACRIPDTLSPLDVAAVDFSQVADDHSDTNSGSAISEPQKPQVFLRQSSRMVARGNTKNTRKSSESPITFLAMSSAENGGNSNNTFLIKEF